MEKDKLSTKNNNLEKPNGATFLQGRAEEKLLEIIWNSSSDSFSFKVNVDTLKHQDQLTLTERRVMNQVARIYDAIGFVGAFLIRAKITLQELLEKGID